MSTDHDEDVIRAFLNRAYALYAMPNGQAHDALTRLVTATRHHTIGGYQPTGTPPNQGSGGKPPVDPMQQIEASGKPPQYVPDQASSIDYRRGKSAGYTQGIVDGWDHAKQHVYEAFHEAVRKALADPEPIRKHREATRDEC